MALSFPVQPARPLAFCASLPMRSMPRGAVGQLCARPGATPMASASPPPQPPQRTPPPAPEKPQTPEYSLQTRLREETSAPFRKVRQFVYLGSAASAAVGGFISGLRIIANLSGVSGTQPLSELLVNVGVDVGAVAFFAFLWSREQAAGAARLERMRRGARIAALTVSEPVTGKIVPLGSFRSQSRVIIVAAPRAALGTSLEGAAAVKKELLASDIIVVPLEIEGAGGGSGGDGDGPAPELPRGSWVARPVNDPEWQEWLASEREQSGRSALSDDDIFVVSVKKNGRVLARTIGPPSWSKLTRDAAVN